MLFKLILLLFGVSLFKQVITSNVKSTLIYQPFELIDDAKSQLDDLEQIILGNILVAHSKVVDLQYDDFYQRVNVQFAAKAILTESYEENQNTLNELRDAAFEDHKNASVCLAGQYEKLNPDNYYEELQECIYLTQNTSDNIFESCIYNVDITINKVHDLTFQLGKCTDDDETCISNIINDIDKLQKLLPLEIEATVNSATDQIQLVKAEIQECSDSQVAKYVLDSNNIITNVTNCINNILD